MNNEPFPVSRISEIESRPEDFRLIERIPLTTAGNKWPVVFNEAKGDEITILLLDTETTGLSPQDCEIIELGMVKIRVSTSSYELIEVTDSISLYQQPKKSIPEKITNITGITNEMVAGHSINEALVEEWLAESAFVVAHNAAFDRPFFEIHFPKLSNYKWVCSVKDVNWQSLGFERSKLEHLLLDNGYFYGAHRAEVDCLAMAWLFHLQGESLKALCHAADSKSVVVKAIGAPFDAKEALKRRGYRWNAGRDGQPKHWWKKVPNEAETEERRFLKELYSESEQLAEFEYNDAFSRYR